LALGLLFGFAAAGESESLAVEIAILKSSNISAYEQAIEGFKSTAPSGAIYAEYDLQGDVEQGRKLARKIRASEASLVVAVGLKAALAAKLEIVDVPIVYMMILDPSKHNLTAPNMTGTLLEIPADRQFKILRAFLPNLRKLGIMSNSHNLARLKELAAQAAANSLQLQEFPVDSEKEVPQQLRSLLSASDALWLVPDSTVLTNESIGFIIETSLAKRVPIIGFSPEFTRLGALLSLSVSYGEVGRETGVLAKRILDGDRKVPAKPIPIERLKITVNLKTARFLGIEFPKEVNHLIDETY
jgi:putative tryptophan/tyrosine transport system substrate-binding protein